MLSSSRSYSSLNTYCQNPKLADLTHCWTKSLENQRMETLSFQTKVLWRYSGRLLQWWYSYLHLNSIGVVLPSRFLHTDVVAAIACSYDVQDASTARHSHWSAKEPYEALAHQIAMNLYGTLIRKKNKRFKKLDKKKEHAISVCAKIQNRR